MEDLLRVGLPIYFILYFGIAFVLKTILVSKRIGKNPLVLPNDDTAYGMITSYFKLTVIAIVCYLITFSFFPKIYALIPPIKSLEIQVLQLIGIGLLLISLVWTVVAQNQMKDSWRIGIDNETPTELVTEGLYTISRNPIYVGMIASLIGLVLLTPTVVSLMFLILGYVFIQFQIRLEEEFLEEQHGQAYKMFKQKTRRLI